MTLTDEHIGQLQIALAALGKARGALISAEVELCRCGPTMARIEGVWSHVNSANEKLEATIKWWKQKLENET